MSTILAVQSCGDKRTSTHSLNDINTGGICTQLSVDLSIVQAN